MAPRAPLGVDAPAEPRLAVAARTLDRAMIDSLWPPKPLPVDQVRRLLPVTFDSLTPEAQDAAYYLADWRARHPGKDPARITPGEVIWLGLLGVSVLATFALALGWSP